MILLVGASASGKTEIAKMLMSKYGMIKMITTTTRDKRVNEVDGRDYFFITKEEFLSRKEEGRFIETTFYNGNYYGSGKDQIGKNKCIVVDANGLKAFTDLHDSRIKTFLLLASEDTCYKRMISRGDGEENAKARIEKDRKEFAIENLVKTDFVINTENSDVETLTDKIYNLYLEASK